MNYNSLRTVAISFLFLYAIIGVVAHLTIKDGKGIYPFFSWFLFTRVPSSIQEVFDMQILQAENTIFSPPMMLEGADTIFSRQLHPWPRQHQRIQRLGIAIRSKRESEIARARNELEATFITQPITYRIIATRFNILEKLRSGAIIETTILREFEFK